MCESIKPLIHLYLLVASVSPWWCVWVLVCVQVGSFSHFLIVAEKNTVRFGEAKRKEGTQTYILNE